MPPKQTRDNPQNLNKPLAPALASGIVKLPITPRLAAHHSNVLGATSPASRCFARSNTPDTARRHGALKDDLTTPAKTLINNNITPRSGPRKSRADTGSASSTPTATPNASNTPTGPKHATAVDRLGKNKRPLSGLVASPRPQSIAVGGYGEALSPHLTSSAFLGQDLSRSGLSSPKEIGASFFHASDSPSSQITVPPPKKSPTFIYANGVVEAMPGTTINSPSPTLSAVSARTHKGQFFRADRDVEDLHLPPIPPLPSLPKLSVSPVPPQTSLSSLHNTPAFRPPSPSKDSFPFPSRQGASQIIRKDIRPKAISIVPPSSHRPPRQRSISSGSIRSRLHNRTSSLSSIEGVKSTDKLSLATTDKCSLARSQTLPQQAPSNLSPNSYSVAPPGTRVPSPVPESDDLEDLPPDSVNNTRPTLQSRQASAISTSFGVPQSPTNGTSGLPTPNLAQLSELAANARRERKVLDLEISNSSLLAINRQLEREVKKQKTEIRRFRRLSRAGRLSTVTARSLGDSQEIDHKEGHDDLGNGLISVSDEDEESESEDDEASSDGNSSDTSSSLTPAALAAKDARKLNKDSKRLQLDLNKHRELLIDSQKVNQSLKRCMAWTEDMISEGKRALEYQVRVSDIKLGGRVLERDVNPEKEEGDLDYSLLSPWTPSLRPDLEASHGMLGLGLDTVDSGRKSWQSEAADSGIELESGRVSALVMPTSFDSEDPDLSVCGAESGLR